MSEGTPRSLLVVLAGKAGANRHDYALFSGEAAPVEGVLTPGVTAPRADRLVWVVHGGETSVRILDFSARSLAQARAMAAFRLRDERADKAEPHVAVRALGGNSWLAAAIDPKDLRAHLAAAAALGLDPDVVLPDCLIPPAPADDAGGAIRFADRFAIRWPSHAMTIDADLAGLVLEGKPWRELSAEAAQAAIRQTGETPALNLRQGEFARRAPAPMGRRAAFAVLGGLLLALLVAAPAVDAIRAGAKARAARAEITQIAATALGPNARLVDPLRQLQGAAAAGSGGAAIADLLAPLFTALEAGNGLTLDSLVFETGEARFVVRHSTPQSIDALRVDLTEAGLAVELGASSAIGGGLSTEILVRRAP